VQVIYKFELRLNATIIKMPKGAKILAVAAQHDKPVIWAQCDPLAEQEIRKFRTLVTGAVEPMDTWTYLGTFQIEWFVGHVFEEPK
jgi:hypothetical protein